jgi:hypothetical protein
MALVPDNSAPAPPPVLSVVVTIVDGGEVLRNFLRALMTQQDPPSMEILVPYDDSVSETASLASEFPSVLFPRMGTIKTERPIRSQAGQHELYDRRRAAGLAAARGSLIGLLEDRGWPRSDWARTAVRLHREEHAVIGGAIEPGPGGLLNRAFYICDFGRYGLPFKSGPATWVSDVNVTYKRHVLDETRNLWQERFSEPIVHWAVLERGGTLYLSSELVVAHRRPPTTLPALLVERFHWGRLFGRIRAAHVGGARRAAYIASGPLLPPLLLVRHARTQYRKGHFARFLPAIPATAVLLVAWIAGEVWGYVTKRA